MKLVLVSLIAFAITYVVIPVIIRFARTCDCLDLPGTRRFHSEGTPKWGGAAFLLAVVPALPFITGISNEVVSFAVASVFLVGIGLIDDYRPLGWQAKFLGITIAATIVIVGGDNVVSQLGFVWDIKSVDLGSFSVPLTYLGIIGVTNAVNLLDGLNGLAGGVSLLGFLFIGIAAALNGNLLVAAVSFAFVGSLAAFLRYNFPRAQLFMGDSGSLFLGFSLAVLSIRLTQGHGSAPEAFYPVLVLLLPIFDTLRVFLMRVLRGRNPFKADKSHLHHLFVRRGVHSTVTVVIFWVISALAGGTALAMREHHSAAFLKVVFAGIVILSIVAISLGWRSRRVQSAGMQSRTSNARFLAKPVFFAAATPEEIVQRTSTQDRKAVFGKGGR